MPPGVSNTPDKRGGYAASSTIRRPWFGCCLMPRQFCDAKAGNGEWLRWDLDHHRRVVDRDEEGLLEILYEQCERAWYK